MDKYMPKVVKSYTQIYGIMLPVNTIYMKTKQGYIWTDFNTINSNRKNIGFCVFFLYKDDERPIKRLLRIGDDGFYQLIAFANKLKKSNNVPGKVELTRQDLQGLAPKNIMVSKAYRACKLYAK